jgi:hypothetical protein
MKRILLTADAGEGGDPSPPNTTPPGVSHSPASPVNPTAAGAPPPAAHTVLTGERTEDSVRLAQELEAERASHAATAADKKAREVRIAELEDELHRIKEVPAPARREKITSRMFTFGRED